jgi:predicted secreted protein
MSAKTKRYSASKWSGEKIVRLDTDDFEEAQRFVANAQFQSLSLNFAISKEALLERLYGIPK